MNINTEVVRERRIPDAMLHLEMAAAMWHTSKVLSSHCQSWNESFLLGNAAATVIQTFSIYSLSIQD